MNQTLIYAGGFKPPTKGHFTVLKEALKQHPDIDEIIIYIGNKSRNNVESYQSDYIWNIYKPYLNNKIKTEIVNQPVKSVINYIKDNPNRDIIWVLGERDETDAKDNIQRITNITRYPNVKMEIIRTNMDVSGTLSRKYIEIGDKESFFNTLPSEIKEKNKIWDIVSKNLINENATYSNNIDYKQIINEICLYLMEKYNFPLIIPNVEYIDGDVENAQTIFTKTGHYDPQNKTITLYTEGRHPRDIVSTFCHEFQHYVQDLEGRLDNVNGQNTMEDDYLDSIEREAYEEGGINFRNWKDLIKKDALKLAEHLKEEIYYQHPLLKQLREKYKDILEQLFIFVKDDNIEINRIKINPKYKNQGYGTKIIEDVILYANKNVKTITLTPSSDFGSSLPRLIAFYKKFGFVKNKQNPKLSDSYIRYPKYS